ncbi:spore cortex biosynthesis protein YabQ [Peribacillus tepidiphilus]|jgi:spore cortex biosynthesis protein YabQ|uniref:spore cortex biosynthesis protein YabQ n=1 Tax=Peribacillus tepidiphilus TaxID=2652445 RepID=UPI001292B4A3|nr:spore cortex biosynthesis protein YabQ [Peribacillus tepidiphilus]
MSLTTQFYTLIAMIGMGSYFGAALDTYNRFLQRSKRNALIVFIHDLLFWLIQGFLIFYVLFLINQGELRFYLFLALLCGFSAYQALFRGIYKSLLEFVISLFKSTVKILTKIFMLGIYKPILAIITFLIFLVINIGKGLFSLVKHIFTVVLSIVRAIVRIILRPLVWMLKAIWNLLPKSVTKRVENYCKKIAGYYKKIKKLLFTWIIKFRNKNHKE